MNQWSRGEKIALYSLLITALGVIVTSLTIPELRRAAGLTDTNKSSVDQSEVQSNSKIENPTTSSNKDSKELSTPAKVTITQNEPGEPMTPTGWRTVARGTIPVSQPWTSAGYFRGKILVIIWGQAVLGGDNVKFGPDGAAEITGPEFPLPGERAFCALLKADSRISKVGRSREFSFPTETEILLGPNDEPGYLGRGFTDNYGQWYYKICSRGQ